MANTTLNRILAGSESGLGTSGEFQRKAGVHLPQSHANALTTNRLKRIPSQTIRQTAKPAHGPQSRPRPSGFALKWLMSASVVAGTSVMFFQPWKLPLAESHPTIDRVEDTRKAVDVQRPAPAATANVALPATIRPWQSAALSARVSGYLTRWHRDLGDRVQAGDLLAEIETPELDQEIASAESLAREADAATVQAKAERIEAQADLKTAEAQLNRVRAELELSRSQLSRREKLVASRVITQEEFDTFSREVEARTAIVAAAESDVTRRQANLETRSAIIDVRQATAKSRQSNVDRLSELQAFKRIVAPFNGIVVRRSAEIGMLVTAGREELFVIEDMSRVRVQINVPQAYSAQTIPGVATSVSVPESSAVVQGTITRVSSSVDSASRTMLAEIELENSSSHLQPGSYAQVTLMTQQTSAGWTVPTNTLLMRVEGPHVVIVNEQDQIELRHVTLGRDLGSRVVVVSGISGNERLVVKPSNDLADGQSVQVNHRSPKSERQAGA